MRLFKATHLLALFLIFVTACAPTRQTVDQSTPTLVFQQPVKVTFDVVDQRSSVSSRNLESNYAGKVSGVPFGVDLPTPDGKSVADYVKDMLVRASNKANTQLGAGGSSAMPKHVSLVLNYFEWSSRPEGVAMRYDVQITVADASGEILITKQIRDESTTTFTTNVPALWISNYVYPPVLQRIMMDETVIQALAQ